MDASKIKVGFCVAYDWQLLRYSLPLVYNAADAICISFDKERISWAGKRFDLNEDAFKSFLREVDPKGKIELVEGDFHVAGLTPMQNEVRQRNRVAQHLGDGGWHIQLDCDEYFLDFQGFVSFLKQLSPQKIRKSNVVCSLITLYKKTKNGFLYIVPGINSHEFIQIATQEPHYEYGRRNGNFNLVTSFVILHQSWARSESEVLEKLTNWGHINDFNTEDYFRKWRSVNDSNYKELKNFHPIDPEKWASLDFTEAPDENGLILHPPEITFPYSKFGLKMKNNRNVARVSSLIRKLF